MHPQQLDIDPPSVADSPDTAAVLPQCNTAVCRKAPQLQAETLTAERFTLGDEEIEQHIRDCGWQAQLAMCRWEAQGNFADRGEADYWRRLMEAAIRARSPAQVQRMQIAQAERMTLEPGAHAA